MAKWPLFPVTVVGSWPRPSWLLEARKRKKENLHELEDQATLLAIKYQEDAGVDIITDGEQRRDNFYSFICDHMDGVQLMTMADLLDYVEDKASFEALLRTLDVPAFSIKNPTITGKLKLRESLVLKDYEFLRQHTKKAVKMTLPGGYLLSRSMWVKALSSQAYPTRQMLIDDIVNILRAELKSLVQAGCDFIQFDEPVLSELAFAGKSNTHTFMCAALAANANPEEELTLAVEIMNRIIEGISGPIIGIHICRGNWSQKEDVLLEGSYDQLIPYLKNMKVQQFVLEYATPRAGSLDALKGLPRGSQLGFGIVNPRTETIESEEWILSRSRQVAEILGKDKIFLNPDCGFGTFADRPVNTVQMAFQKLAKLSEVAAKLRL
ncbi:MAG: cobalamin-independent methionine synthase II family protein [Planctomycetota bacterium]